MLSSTLSPTKRKGMFTSTKSMFKSLYSTKKKQKQIKWTILVDIAFYCRSINQNLSNFIGASYIVALKYNNINDQVAQQLDYGGGDLSLCGHKGSLALYIYIYGNICLYKHRKTVALYKVHSDL